VFWHPYHHPPCVRPCVEVVIFVISFGLQNCVCCYSERGTAETGSSEQYLHYLRGFTSHWRKPDDIFMYRKFTRAVVVSRPWDTNGRGPSLRCQRFLSDIRLAIWDRHLTIFSERELTFTFAVRRPSVCLSVCLSSVTFVHPTQPMEIFGNVSAPCNTLVTWQHPGKILRRSSQGNPSVGG